MRPSFRGRLGVSMVAACALASAAPAPAHAQSPDVATPARAVVVVTVTPELREVDAARLCGAVGGELGVEVVTADDARARLASGRFDFGVDRVAGQLVVSYSGGAEPLVRRVQLPADAEETMRTAVVLAGNLGRDEAADLATEIRRSRPPPPSTATRLEEEERATSERDEETLRRMLADDATRDRTVRIVSSLGLMAFGAGAVAVGVLARPTARVDVSAIVNPAGLPLVFVGLFGIPFVPSDVGLTRTSALEELSQDDPPSGETGRPWFRENVEQKWKKVAADADERRAAFTAWMGGAGVLEMALGGTLLALGDWRDKIQAPVDIGGIVVGAGLVTWALVARAGETEVESRLHEYERVVGRRIELQVGPSASPVPSGFVVGARGQWM